MIASPEAMDALKGIGLNLYERKLWVALLAKSTATAGELSEMANVPRSRTYDVLQTLSEKGFVIVQPSKPLRYIAIPPRDALEKVKGKLKESLRKKIGRIERIEDSDIIKELESLHERGLKLVSLEDMTGALKGKYSVIQQMESMLKGATSSVNIVTTPLGLNEIFENYISVLKKLNEKGVKIKIATKVDDNTVDAVKALSSVAEIRNISGMKIPLSGRFCVVDGKELAMGLSDPENVHSSQDMMFWTKSSYAAKNVVEPLFELVWERSSSI